jgi:GH18 family chitinase
MAANPAARAAFVKNLVDLCDEGVDGIDMDWEYPNANSAANFALMMKELGTALKAKGKFLSAAVIAQGDWAGQHIRASVFESVDFLNIMSYDATHVEHHASYDLAVSSLDYWTRRGLPKHKAVLGLPFYGRSARGGSQYVSYKDLVSQNPGAAQTDVSNGLYYNGIPTIQKKTDLAYQKAGGVMIWELSQDASGANSLLSAIHAKASTYPSTALGPRARGPAGRLSVAGPGLVRFLPAASGRYSVRLRTLTGAGLGAVPLSGAGAADGALEYRFDPAGVPAGAYLVEVLGAGVREAVPLLLP